MERLLAGNNNVMDIVNRIKRDGICILRNYVDKKLLKKIDAEFESILQRHAPQNTKNKIVITNVNSNIVNGEQNRNLNTFFTSPFIRNIANNIIHQWKFNNLYIHKDYENAETNNTYPHFDYYRQLKFYLCVNDMDKSNGCFKALPNTKKLVEEKRKNNAFLNNFTKGHERYNGTEIKIEELIPIECKAGDLIIFDTNCIHAGGDKFEEGKCRKVIRLHINNKNGSAENCIFNK